MNKQKNYYSINGIIFFYLFMIAFFTSFCNKLCGWDKDVLIVVVRIFLSYESHFGAQKKNESHPDKFDGVVYVISFLEVF